MYLLAILQGCLHELKSLTIPYKNHFPGQDHFQEISSIKGFQEAFLLNFSSIITEFRMCILGREGEKIIFAEMCKYREFLLVFMVLIINFSSVLLFHVMLRLSFIL